MDNVKKDILGEKKRKPAFLKYGIIALAAVAVIAAVVLIVLKISGSYVATVSSEKIGLGEYNYFLKVQKSNMLSEAQSSDPTVTDTTFWNTKIGGETAFEVAKKKTLEGLKDFKIQLIKAKEKKISLTDKELKSIDNSIKTNIIQQLGAGNRVKANKALIEQYGISLDEIKQLQIDMVKIQKYQESLVTNEEAKKEYDKDPTSFDTVTVTHILFEYTGKDGKRTKEQSKKLAEDTLTKVKAGEDAKELAKKLSEDPGVTQNSGVYTFTKYDNYLAEFINWALKAKTGDSAVVETQVGYHVMKLDKRVASTYDNAKSKIVQEISNTKVETNLTKWRGEAQYDIKINQKVYNAIKK